MRFTRTAAMLAFACTACARPVGGGGAEWQPRFGPVLEDEVIVGRVRAPGRVWLMTSLDALVAVNLQEKTHVRHPVRPLASGQHVWGLATTGHRGAGFWTLTGRTQLAHVTDDGLLDRRFDVGEPHVAVHSGIGELVYQVVNMAPPADALVAGPPGLAPRRRWSSMRTRLLDGLRGHAAALNIVSCGASEHVTIPCWFSDQATVTLTGAAGASSTVALEALAPVEPFALLDAPVPRRPIADVWISAAGELWVLSAGEPARTDLADRRGAWTLGRYRPDGRVVRRTPLQQPARMILGVTGESAVLLAWDGRVVEVQP